jgi:sorbitol/mannitol transport system permease protein
MSRRPDRLSPDQAPYRCPRLRAQEFTGFDHYRRILTSPEAIDLILLSLKFTAVVVAASLLIGLGIALVLNEDFPGRQR